MVSCGFGLRPEEASKPAMVVTARDAPRPLHRSLQTRRPRLARPCVAAARRLQGRLRQPSWAWQDSWEPEGLQGLESHQGHKLSEGLLYLLGIQSFVGEDEAPSVARSIARSIVNDTRDR